MSQKKEISQKYFTFDGASKDSVSSVSTSTSLIKLPGEINGNDFRVLNLNNCEIKLLDYMERLILSNLSKCKLFLGPTKETVVMRNCSASKVTVACKELRLNECEDLEIFVYVTQKDGIVMEGCKNVRIYKFNGCYSGLTQHFKDAKLEIEPEYELSVTDFSENDEELEQPHYTVYNDEIAEEDLWKIELENAKGEPENPVHSVLAASVKPNPPPKVQNLPSDLKAYFEPAEDKPVSPEKSQKSTASPVSKTTPSPKKEEGNVDNVKKYEAFLKEHLSSRQKKAQETEKKMQEDAVADLDNFYAERTKKIAENHMKNEEREKKLKKEKEEREREVRESSKDEKLVWKKVIELVEKEIDAPEELDEGEDAKEIKESRLRMLNLVKEISA